MSNYRKTMASALREMHSLDEGKMKDLLIRAQELMGPSKNRKEGIQMVAKGLKVSEKEATKLVDAVIKMNEELAKIKGKTPGDEGRRSAVEDDIERAEKKGDKKEVEKLKEADLDEDILPQLFMGGIAAAVLPAIFISMREIIRDTPLESSIKKIVDKLKKDKKYKMSGSEKSDVKGFVSKVEKDKPSLLQKAMKKFKEELDLDEAKKKPVSQMTPKEKEADAARRKEYKAYQKSKRNEETDLEEGKMSQLHQHIKDKKSAEEIAKLMKVDVKTIKALMSSYESTDGDNMEQNGKYMEMLAAACGGGGGGGSMPGLESVQQEGAAADARRAISKDKDLRRGKDSADDDDFASDDDVKGASKNIIMQLRKAGNRASQGVEFADGKKVQIPAKMAIAVQSKYNSMKKPADKEKFQAKIGKSYRDMLSALKEELQPQKESILERMNRKLKENKDG